MAKCDEGYLCEVCGEEVSRMIDSALYLQYVVGWIDPETLHTHRDSHLLCNPALSQFIEHKRFSGIRAEGDFHRDALDESFVQARVELLTRGYERLLIVQKKASAMSITEYPLPEARARWSQ